MVLPEYDARCPPHPTDGMNAPVCLCDEPWLCRIIRYQYDGSDSDGDDCKITEYNANLTCEISFAVTEDIPGPAYVYYELTNFFQNHAT